MPPKISSTIQEMTTAVRKSEWQKKNVTTHIVNSKSKLPEQRSIMAAIGRASPYDRIEIEGGEYHELISITFPVELVGVIGEKPVIVSRGTGLQIASECDCYVEGIALENRSKEGEDYAVVCSGGSPIFVNCKMSNVTVVGTSKPTFSNCDISDSPSGVGVKVQCLNSLQVSNAPSPTFDNCKIQNHIRVAVIVEGVGSALSAMFRQCRITQPQGATCIACVEGVAASNLALANRFVTFQENIISYKRSQLNSAGEVEIVSVPAVQTDYRYSASIGLGPREPACMYINGCGRSLHIQDNDFTDGVVGFFLERGAAPIMDGNKVRRMSSCGMRIAVGNRGANAENGESCSEVRCGVTFERCSTGIEILLNSETILPACQSPIAAALTDLYHPLFEELDKIYRGNGAVGSSDWSQKIYSAVIELTSKCNIPSRAGGAAEHMSVASPNWDVVQALAQMHHTDLATPPNDVEHAKRDAISNFVTHVASTLRQVAPSAMHISQAKFTDSTKHAVRFGPGSYGILKYCHFEGVTGGSAIVVERDSFPVVTNCNFSGCARAAVECHRSSQSIFLGNQFGRGTGETAIYCRPGSEGLFASNVIEYNAGFGVVVEGASTPTFFRNLIQNNTLGGALIHNHSRPLFDRNAFKANKKQIVVSDYSSPKLFYNDIFGGGIGVSFTTCAVGFMTGNCIFDNTETGINIETDADPRIEENLLARNVGNGITIRDNGIGTISSNLIVSSGQFGVVCSSGGDCTCRGNTIGLNTLGGIHVTAEGIGLFEKNDIFCNQIEGNVLISGKHSNPVFDKNRIWRSRSGGGVVCDDFGGGTVKRNTIVSNGGCGIGLYRRCSTVFEHNRIESQLIGVCASLVGGGVVRKNKICFNGRCGVYIDQLAAPDIRDNSIDMNYCGLELRTLPGNGKVSTNSLEGNVFGVISGQSDALPACVQDAAIKFDLTDINSIKNFATIASTQARRPSLSLAQQLREQQQSANNSTYGIGDVKNNNLLKKTSGIDSRRSSLNSNNGGDENNSNNASDNFDINKPCLIFENHIAFNGICGVALLMHASGKFEKNNIIGNAFCGVVVTAKRAFELHNFANTTYLKDNNFAETINILTSHKQAPSFATDAGQGGLYGTAEMDENTITLHPHAGIFVEHFEHASEFRFTSNEIHKNSMGIRLGNGARSPGLMFDDNEISKNVVGLHCGGSGNAAGTFVDNLFDQNSFAGAILSGDCVTKFQTGNRFVNSRYFGCWVLDSASPVFEKGNIFAENVVAGVALQHGSTTSAIFNGCIFKHNDRFGVFVYSFDANQPKFNPSSGEIEMPKMQNNNNNNNRNNNNNNTSHSAEMEAQKKKVASMNPIKKISCFRNCIVRDNGLVGVFVGALSKDFSDDIHLRGSVHHSSLLELSDLNANNNNNNSNASNKNTEAFTNFQAFANELDETISATGLISGNLSSPQARQQQSSSGSFNENSSNNRIVGPSALNQEPSPFAKGKGRNSFIPSANNNNNNNFHAEGGRSLAGQPPYKGYVRGGSVLFYQCAIKSNRLGTLVDRNADPVFMKNVVASNFSAGIILSPGSIACFNDNVIESNALVGIVACPQAKSAVIACEILENNKADLLDAISKFDEKMHPIGGVAALISLETVKFSESDLANSPSRWSKHESENTRGARAESYVKRSVAQLSTIWVACARADSRMAHRSAHHYSSSSKYRLSPSSLFSLTANPESPLRDSRNGNNNGNNNAPRRNGLGVVTVSQGKQQQTSADESNSASFVPPPPPTSLPPTVSGRARSRSVITLKPLNSFGQPIIPENSTSNQNQNNNNNPSSSNNNNNTTLMDIGRITKYRLHSLVHGVGIWVEEGSECRITHNTVFGHAGCGILITTEGLTDDSRNSFESEMLAQTAATVAPGDRFSTALQEAMAFVAGGNAIAASAIRMNLIHHNRGVGIRVVCCSSGIVEGLMKHQRSNNNINNNNVKSPIKQTTNSTTTKVSSAAAALKAQVRKKTNDLLDLSELVDAPGCLPNSVHPFLTHVTAKNSPLTCPGLGDVNVAVIDRLLNSDDIIGGSHADASKSSLVRIEDNEIEYNLNGGLLVEFVLCAGSLVNNSSDSLDDTRRFDLVGDTIVAPTRVIGNTFRSNGKGGSIMVRSTIHVDLLHTTSAESNGSSSASSLHDADYVNSLIRSSSLPGLAKVSNFYMPCVVESNIFEDVAAMYNNTNNNTSNNNNRAPCVAVLGHSTCNIRFNDFHNVSSGSAIVVARETFIDTSPHAKKELGGDPRSDTLDASIVASGVVIGPQNTFTKNNIDITISGTALNDCAVIGNVFKETSGISLLVTGGARPVAVGNRFHGQCHQNLAALRSLVGKVWDKVVAIPSATLASTNGSSAVVCSSRHTSPWIIANQFDNNDCGIRITEDSSALVSLNMFSGNKGTSIAVDNAQHGGPLIERNLLCNSHEEGILIEGFETAAVVRKNLFRDIVLTKFENHRDVLAERGSSLVSGIHVRDGASPWIDSNGFQDVTVGVLLQNPGKSCAVSRNAFFRCGTGTLIGHSSIGSVNPNSLENTANSISGMNNSSSSSSSPLLAKLPDFAISTSSSATLEAISKVVTDSNVAVVTHNVYECPLGLGVHVVDAPQEDAAAFSSNVFLSTSFCTGEGGKSIAAMKNIFIGAVTSLGHSEALASGGGASAGAVNSPSTLPPLSPGAVSSSNAKNNNQQQVQTGADISLQLQRGSRTTFLENFVIGSKVGATVESGAEGLVQGGIFYRCSTAVEMQAAGIKTIVDHCQVLSCNGIAVRLASGQVRRCKIYKTSGSFAVDFSAPHQKEFATLAESEVYCCDNDAVRFSGSGLIERSSVAIAKHGVKFGGGIGAVSELRSTNVMDMERVGVLFARGQNGALMDCDVFDCGICAVALEETATGEIDGSRISSTLDHGAIDLESGTRVKLGTNTIRNQFSPAHKGKLSQVRQKDILAVVNKYLDAAVVEEEKALGNAKWAVEQRERLLGSESEIFIRNAHKILFENSERNRERANYVAEQRKNRLEASGWSSIASASNNNNNHNNNASKKSNNSNNSNEHPDSIVPSFNTISPSRKTRDRGFELSNFIAQKKASRAQSANLIQVASEQPKQKNKLLSSSPASKSSEERVNASLAAVTRAFESGYLSGATSDNNNKNNNEKVEKKTSLLRKNSFNNNNNANQNNDNDGGSRPNSRPSSSSAPTATKRKQSVTGVAPPTNVSKPTRTDHAFGVAQKKTASSIAKETEADQSVQRLQRRPNASLPDIHNTSDSYAANAGAVTDSNENNNNNNNDKDSKTGVAKKKKSSGASAKRSGSRSAKRGDGGADTPVESSELQNLMTRQTPKLSRVLVHSLGDAEDSGLTAQVTSVLEDALGSHCMIMKTTSDDPIEAMLGAASCSHVIVVYPTFPMRRRPTQEDDKALLAITCYVELALKEKIEFLHQPLQQQLDQEEGANGKKPRIIFSGAYSVIQPPPGFGSTLNANNNNNNTTTTRTKPLSEVDKFLSGNGNGNDDDENGADNNENVSSSALPPLQKVPANMITSPTSPSSATATTLTPQSLLSLVDRAIQLPTQTFRPVAGAGGLYQTLTGKKAPRNATFLMSPSSLQQNNSSNFSGVRDSNRRKSVSILM